MTDIADPTGWQLTAADEHPHAPGAGDVWNESWYFDFASRDGSLGGYVRLGFHPNLATGQVAGAGAPGVAGQVWYWACVVGEGRPLVTVIDHEVAMPKAGTVEIRGEGLWATHTIETPFDHVTIGAEAFALGLDDPLDVYGPMRGERVPFGLDLEWETDGGVYPYPGVSRYEVPCRVHGEILLGDEVIDFDGIGQRDHSWGERDWWNPRWVWTSGALDDGTRFHATPALWVGEQKVPYHPGYVAPAGTAPVPGQLATTDAVSDLDGEGFARTATVTIGDLVLAVEPVAFAPVLLTAPDGRTSRFARALCRFREVGGTRTGVGWTEWNQPQTH
jgi:hypothetical protein